MSILALAYPSESSADMTSILSSVFQNKNINSAHEIEAVVSKNAQTMSLLQSPANPNQASSTLDQKKSYKAFVAVVDNQALSNENTAVPSDTATVVKDYMSDRISLYTVHDGDTVEQVAQMYGVSASTILWANDLKKGSNLTKDQVLVIMPMNGVKYVVKKGDTLNTVAVAYKSDSSEIANFNNMDIGAALSAGDTIIIPDAEGTLTAAEDKKQQDAADAAKKKADEKIAKDKAAKDKLATKKAQLKIKLAATVDSASNSTVAVDDSSQTHGDGTGYFTRPVVGGVRTQGLHGHNGIDLASSYGTPILAAASGQVVVAKTGGWGGGYGNYVVIQHENGMQTLYAHMSEVLVHTGEQVGKSDQVGKMGNSGESTGVHLHFEVRGGRNPF